MDKFEAERRLEVVSAELRKLAEEVHALAEPQVRTVPAIGPHQVLTIGTAPGGESFVTVTHPPGATTVLSVQPDGRIDTRPQGTQGPYETALLAGDRVIYAPQGPTGGVFILPFTPVIPNE
jgi:hypothetical protein